MMRRHAFGTPIASVALLLALITAGCAGRTLVGRVKDKNPLLKPELVSEGIAIPTKDAQIIANAGESVAPADRSRPQDNRYAAAGSQYYHPTFHQSAIFEAKNPQSLVFLVELANRWPELTHAENYEVTLVDDRGKSFKPARVQGGRARTVAQTMALGRLDVTHMVVSTGAATYAFKHTEEVATDASKVMLAARTILAFQGDPVLTRETKRLTLQLKHPHRTLVFIWDFTQ